ncbi:MAG TPA: GNAT family N-acetyltransferase [Devosia sp.]|nr:GNAT family N-acetyltransferase [Devosia sp.]
MARAPGFELIRSDAAFEALEPDWRALFERAGRPSPFLDFDWVRMTWQRVALEGPPAQLAIVRRDGRLALGLLLQQMPYRGLFQRYHGALTELPAFTEPLVAAEDVAGLTAELLRGLGGQWLTFSLVLARLRDDAPVRQALAPRIRSEMTLGMAPMVDISGGFDGYYNAFSGGTRNQLSRKRRKLAAGGAVVLRLATEDSFDADFDWLLEHKRSWSPPDGGPLRAWVTEAGSEDDLRHIGKRWIADGRMVLGTLDSGDRRVAGGMVLVAGAEATYYVLTYDPAFAYYSPGRLLTLQLIEHVAGLGVERFDFMRGDQQWKDRLKNAVRGVRRIRVALG